MECCPNYIRMGCRELRCNREVGHAGNCNPLSNSEPVSAYQTVIVPDGSAEVHYIDNSPEARITQLEEELETLRQQYDALAQRVGQIEHNADPSGDWMR